MPSRLPHVSSARRWRWLVLPALAAATFGGCAYAPQSAAAAAAQAGPLQGARAIAQGPSFPGPRYLRIALRDGQAQGCLSTDWYGNVPMQALRLDGDVARFMLDNGNPRLPAQPWTASWKRASCTWSAASGTSKSTWKSDALSSESQACPEPD